MADTKVQAGDSIGERYRLTQQVAEDELGALWLAVDAQTERDVVMRLLRPEAITPQAPALLERLAALRHETLAAITAWDLEHSPPHVVYEGVGGTALTTFLSDGAIPWDSACEIAAQLLAALSYIHEHGSAYGALRPQAVWIAADNRVLLGDLGLNAALASSPAEGGDGAPPHDMTPRADLAALGAFMRCLIAGSDAAGHAPMELDAPPAVATFIARCRDRDAESPFADAQEAHDTLREIMRRELTEPPAPAASEPPVESAPVEPSAPEPPVEPAPPPQQQTPPPPEGDTVARIRDLEHRLRRAGQAPELEAELTRLREAHGRAELQRIAGMKGRAILRRHDTASGLTVAIFVAGCIIGFGLLWWILSSYLRTVPLTEALRAALTYLALVAYAGLGVWMAVALLLTRVHLACYAVISDLEVLCRDEAKGIVIACLGAADIRSVTLVSYDEKAPEQTVVDIATWSGSKCRLDFAARAREGDMRVTA